MKARDIPNLICIARIVLVVPTVIALTSDRFDWALALFVVAGVSDGLDGYLAKHYGWTSRLGSLLDPLADKLLLISVAVTCGSLGLIPLWLVAIMIARDLVIVGGALAYHRRFGPFEGEPLMSSKLNTFVQLTLLATVMVAQALAPVPPRLIDLLVLAAAATTVWSGIGYVVEWTRRASERER